MWIKTINYEKSTGSLRKLYNHIKDGDDTVIIDNILKIHSLHPKTLEAHLMLYEEMMHGENNLSQRQREMIGVVVSNSNECKY